MGTEFELNAPEPPPLHQAVLEAVDEITEENEAPECRCGGDLPHTHPNTPWENQVD